MTAATDGKQENTCKHVDSLHSPQNNTIWDLEASRCARNNVRGCANIFHYREFHSEKCICCPFVEPPTPSPLDLEAKEVSLRKIN